jgi:hypothetical protein
MPIRFPVSRPHPRYYDVFACILRMGMDEVDALK